MTPAEAAAKSAERAMTNAVRQFTENQGEEAWAAAGDSMSGIVVEVKIRRVSVGSA